MTLVINLFGGPGSGKSTGATAIFSMLKMHDVNAEYVPEYAKDLAWEKTLQVYYNPWNMLGEQHNRQHRLIDQADVIITDSPLLQQAAYVDDKFYHDTCLGLFNKFENVNWFIQRSKTFNPKGRKHNFDESVIIDKKILDMLGDDNIPFNSTKGNHEGYNYIVQAILVRLGVDRRIQLVSN